jgi:hypothetical protein
MVAPLVSLLGTARTLSEESSRFSLATRRPPRAVRLALRVESPVLPREVSSPLCLRTRLLAGPSASSAVTAVRALAAPHRSPLEELLVRLMQADFSLSTEARPRLTLVVPCQSRLA